MSKLLRSGSKVYGDGESWINFWFFPLLTADEAKDAIYQHTDSPHNGGPGREFCRRATVRNSVGHTLIEQHGGLDI